MGAVSSWAPGGGGLFSHALARLPEKPEAVFRKLPKIRCETDGTFCESPESFHDNSRSIDESLMKLWKKLQVPSGNFSKAASRCQSLIMLLWGHVKRCPGRKLPEENPSRHARGASRRSTRVPTQTDLNRLEGDAD